ncbi:securin-like [Mustela nigripes]|uniref:securin-like n=1 Tax=Mustela nigripes TaxID=77151 RepID=UPI002814F490|nr:securin-like [Mustela nigripes]
MRNPTVGHQLEDQESWWHNSGLRTRGPNGVSALPEARGLKARGMLVQQEPSDSIVLIISTSTEPSKSADDTQAAVPRVARKALGTVNRATENSVKTSGPLKQKQPTFSAKKVTEKTVKAKSSVPASDDTYPEIEKFFLFNPLDFESFDLPEEHQIEHLPLNGVPLMILDEERELEKLLHLGPPSPLKIPSPPWESNLLQSPSVLSTLDVELPPVCYDLDI